MTQQFFTIILRSMAFLALFASVAEADNWRRWRGPNADGSSATANPPTHWGEENNIKWKVAIPGRGSSTPIIWEENVFILTAIRTDRQRKSDGKPAQVQVGFGFSPAPTHYHQFVVICYDRNNGQEKWRTVATEAVPHEAGHKTNNFASYSPVTDGDHLFVSFGSHGVFCLDFKGNVLWEKQLGQMKTQLGYGEGSSPALHGETLVVPFDHEKQSFMVALDTKTGDEKWRVDRREATTWATPRIVEHKGRQQVIANGIVVSAYDLADGSLIWECSGQAHSPIPSPIAKDGVTYCMTGFLGNAVLAISLDAKGDVTDTKSLLWKRHDAAPYISSAALYKGQLYYTKSSGNVLTSVDAITGETVFEKKRIQGIRNIYASVVAAADRLYFTGRNGTTVVIEHGDDYKALATNRLDATVDASPALVGNEIFLRGEKHLYCIAEE